MALAAVIFDMDGVLIDSEPIHSYARTKVFRKLKLDIPPEEHGSFAGRSNLEMWRFYKEKFFLNQSLTELNEWQVDITLEVLQGQSREPMPGVKALMGDLAECGIKIALASSSPQRHIEAVLRALSLREHFQVVISGERVPLAKPHPEIFLLAAKALGVEPSRCVVIEDTFHGVTAAKAANMKCIGFLNPNSGNQDLSQSHLQITRFEDLQVKDLRMLFCDDC